MIPAFANLINISNASLQIHLYEAYQIVNLLRQWPLGYAAVFQKNGIGQQENMAESQVQQEYLNVGVRESL